MVVGFNHNVRYKGEVFHVQTEDGGLKSPHIVTLLYKGGTIVASRKTSYADILETEGLARVVEERMKEQHRQMLRRLKSGEFDTVIEGRPSGPAPSPAAPRTTARVRSGAEEHRPSTRPAAEQQPLPPAAAPSSRPASGPKRGKFVPETNLDEIILSYLLGEEQND